MTNQYLLHKVLRLKSGESILDRAKQVSSTWQQALKQHRAIAIIRSQNFNLGWAMAKAVTAGGIGLIEIAWNSKEPEILINRLRSELPNCIIGAGTILNREDLEKAIAAGAQFAFAPHLDLKMIQIAVNSYQIPFIPGALSPTEIVTAWQAGASAVKVFPVAAVGGINYIKHLSKPLGQIPLIPTGGVTIDNAKEYINSGAIAVGLSTQLFLPQFVAQRNWTAIAAKVKGLVTLLNSQ